LDISPTISVKHKALFRPGQHLTARRDSVGFSSCHLRLNSSFSLLRTGWLSLVDLFSPIDNAQLDRQCHKTPQKTQIARSLPPWRPGCLEPRRHGITQCHQQRLETLEIQNGRQEHLYCVAGFSEL
jgi:hypothetical protein